MNIFEFSRRSMYSDPSTIDFHENILSCIGETPLVRINDFFSGSKGLVLAKVETFNPGSSVKDRIGLGIIEQAEREGRLKPGGTIVEATSGNTGMGLAIAAAVKGYKCIFTMPDKMSKEKIAALRAFGAEVIVTPTAVPHDSPESYTEVAKRLVAETPNSILADQYNNPKNPEAHYLTTGPEIWKQTNGQIDTFVCSIGTGGTITGIGKFLKEKRPDVKVVGVDPVGSVFTEYFRTGSYPHVIKTYLVEGIGQDYIPNTLGFQYIDDVVQIGDKESFHTARRFTRTTGIFVGGSAGTALAGAAKLAAAMNENEVMVVLLPDSGERYVSKFYNDDWMRENRMLVPEKVTLRYLIETRKGVPKLIAIQPDNVIREAFELIKQHNINQMPVIDKNECIGSVFESDLLNAVLNDASLFGAPVSTIMKPAFPVLDKEELLVSATTFLRQRNDAVLVRDGNEIIGILTRFDVIEHLAQNNN